MVPKKLSESPQHLELILVCSGFEDPWFICEARVVHLNVQWNLDLTKGKGTGKICWQKQGLHVVTLMFFSI